MKVTDLLQRVVVMNPVRKQDKSFAWATDAQKAEAGNPNIATLPKVSLQVKRG
jgi:hypothetical protein